LLVLVDTSEVPSDQSFPTTLQRTVPHEEWIDAMPHPVMRDDFILARTTFDEDDLWTDMVGGLFEGYPASDLELPGIIA
jgi:hypothetical protein